MAGARTMERQIGDILVEQGVLSPLQLDEALQRQRLTGDMLGRVLVSMGYCEEQHIIEALGVQSGMERVDLTKLKIPEDVIRRKLSLAPDEATGKLVEEALSNGGRDNISLVIVKVSEST